MAVTIVRTASSSQIGSLLTQASASTTYLTQSSASTTYATKASPTFTGTVETAAINMNGSLNLNNYNINQVGNLEFNDPGVGEGISWIGGNLWKIYESPNDLTTNSLGNLQFVQGTTRRLTIDTAGELFVSNSIAIGDNTTSTAARYLHIGPGRTDSGYAYIDLVGDTTYTDYGARFLRGNTGSNTYTNLLHKGTGALQLIAENAGSITLGTSNTTRMTITSAGDIGIGTGSPSSNVHIVDPNAATSDIRLGNNVNGTVMNLYTSTADLNLFNVTAAGSLSLGTNNTTIMTINSAGNTTFTGNVSTTGKVTDSLPAPVIDYSTSGSSDNVMAVTAVTFSDVTTTASGTVQVSITCPSAIYATVSYSAWLTAGPNTSAESLRVSTTATGATTWSSGGAKGWGNALWTTGIAANGSGQSASSDFTTLLNAGTTTITMQAYRTTTALTTANISFPYLSVTPISWA
jgi:hypothetical protein